MRRPAILLVGMLCCTPVVAAPTSFLEFAYITGGENGENGPGEEDGFEFAGRYAFNELWYVGGAVGHYDRDGFAENDYFNANVGAQPRINEKTDLILEFGLWKGDQDFDAGGDADPTSAEFKFGVTSDISEKFTGFGAISLIAGDLDTGDDDDIRNFIWTAGGRYHFTRHFAVSLQVIEGHNGVNGQSDVARIAGRWTF